MLHFVFHLHQILCLLFIQALLRQPLAFAISNCSLDFQPCIAYAFMEGHHIKNQEKRPAKSMNGLTLTLVSWVQKEMLSKNQRPRDSDHFKSVDISVSVFHSYPLNVFVQSRVTWRILCQASSLSRFTCWVACGWYTFFTKE